MGPTWVQVGAKLGSKSSLNFNEKNKLILECILDVFGLDFGHLLGSKMEPTSELKTRGVKTAKFDSRVHGSSIFDVTGM